MKTVFYIVALFIFSLSAVAQQQSENDESDPKFIVPKSEYRLTILINKLEDENKESSVHIKECDYFLNILENFTPEYKNLDKFNTDFESLKKATRRLNETYIRMPYEGYKNIKLTSVRDKLTKTLSRFLRIAYDESEVDLNIGLEEAKTSLSNFLDETEEAINNIKKIKEDLIINIEKNQSYLEKLYDSKSQSSDIHKIAIRWGLPAFCITILSLFLYPYYLERNKESSGSNDNNKKYLLDVATVLLLTLTILILGLARMISSEVLGTLLGGIAAYVLNKSGR